MLAPAALVAGEPGQIPAYLLELPVSIATVLVAETNSSTLHEFSHGPDGLRHTGESYMSVGQNGVGKQRAWDRKTPLGIYFVDEQLDTSKLHQKYGPTAFPLDYPNIWDRINKRSGDGIWIHGVTPNGGQRPPLDTDGCIALPNDELLALAGHLQPRITPVLIARDIKWADEDSLASTQNKLRAALDAWAASWQRGDVYGFLGLYAEDFGYRGMNRDEWNAFRTQSMTRAPAERIELRNVLILADPEHKGLYLSRFEQSIVYADRTVTTTKRLYWQRLDNGEVRIVAEDNG